MEYTVRVVNFARVCEWVRCNWHHRRRYNEKKSREYCSGWLLRRICVSPRCVEKQRKAYLFAANNVINTFPKHTKQEFSVFNEFHITFLCKTRLSFVSICISFMFLFNLKMHSSGTSVTSFPRLERFGGSCLGNGLLCRNVDLLPYSLGKHQISAKRKIPCNWRRAQLNLVTANAISKYRWSRKKNN